MNYSYIKMNNTPSRLIFKNEKLSVLIIILISGILMIGFGYMFYSFPKHIENSYEIYGNDPSISTIEIYNYVEMGEIDIELLTDNTKIFTANWSYDTTSGYGSVSDIITYRKIGNVIKIYIEFEHDQAVQDLKVNAYINPNYQIYSFTSNSLTGNVKLKCESMNFEQFQIETTSGEIDVTFDYIAFLNDLRIKSDSGRIIMNCWELYFRGNGTFEILTEDSYIDVDWAQHVKVNHNVNISFTSNNYAELEYWCPYDVNRYDVNYHSVGGTKHFSGEPTNFIEVFSNHYHSINVNDTSMDFLTINMYSIDGYLWVYLKDCFKPQRYCDQTMPQVPWEVLTNGTYLISDSKYDISKILINNNTNYDITYSVLPAESDYIVIINWNLTYYQGPNFGLGFIEVGIREKVIDDTLNIDIYPIYEVDKIRPIFAGGYLIVSIYPGY